VFEQVCVGVAHMHSLAPPVAHRDIKLENVLGAADGRFILCDFGSATTERLTEQRTRQQVVVEEEKIHKYSTLMYRAPEMVDLYLNCEVAEKVDCWAMGCILFALCFRDHPFDSESTLQILNASYTAPEGQERSPKMMEFIQALLAPDPADRLSAAEALSWCSALRHDREALRPEPCAAQLQQREERRQRRQQQEREGQERRQHHQQQREQRRRWQQQRPPQRRQQQQQPPEGRGSLGTSWSAEFDDDFDVGAPASRLVIPPRFVDLQLTCDKGIVAVALAANVAPDCIGTSTSAREVSCSFAAEGWEASFAETTIEATNVLPPPPTPPALPPPPPIAAATRPSGLFIPRAISTTPMHLGHPTPRDADDDFGEFSAAADEGWGVDGWGVDSKSDGFGAFEQVGRGSTGVGATVATGLAVPLPSSPGSEFGDFSAGQQQGVEEEDAFGEFSAMVGHKAGGDLD